MNHENIRQMTAVRLKELERHQMTVVAETVAVQSYRCHRPVDGRVMSFLVTFTPEGAVLQGDFVPERNGSVVSQGRYGREWFAGNLDHDYLAEKFLQKGWHAENAREWLGREIDRMKCLRDEELDDDLPGGCTPYWGTLQDRVDALGEMREAGDPELLENPGRFRDAIEEIEQTDFDFESSPWGYKPREVADLAAIQQVFARLYRAHVTAKEA